MPINMKKDDKYHLSSSFLSNGALETTRTFDPLLRRQMLYPAELRGQQ